MQGTCALNKSLLSLLMGVSGGFIAFSPPALAQDGVLEEVIVTARKRAESLQETPVAVTSSRASMKR